MRIGNDTANNFTPPVLEKFLKRQKDSTPQVVYIHTEVLTFFSKSLQNKIGGAKWQEKQKRNGKI